MSGVEVWAAGRDASWYACPDTHKPKKLHVVNGDTGACASVHTMFVLDGNMQMPAAQVPPGRRCQRPGCRVRWPAYEPRQATAEDRAG